jgi:hypothetical protein
MLDEGITREAINRIQKLRKKVMYTFSDHLIYAIWKQNKQGSAIPEVTTKLN